MEIERDEYGSFKYDDAVSPFGEDYLCEDNPNILKLMRQKEVENIKACDTYWYEEFDWARSDLYNDIKYMDGMQGMFNCMKEGTINRSNNKYQFII